MDRQRNHPPGRRSTGSGSGPAHRRTRRCSSSPRTSACPARRARGAASRPSQGRHRPGRRSGTTPAAGARPLPAP
ncbi:hypothetical protein G6F63_016915 [Rhizopus arrhizus]|nr:hypothetical protein G6F63_016915 [Rhizopus arrhizus]